MKSIIVKILLSIVILVISANLMLLGESLEDYLVSNFKVGWYSSFIAGRIFTSLLIFLAFHALLNTKKKWYLTSLGISAFILLIDATFLISEQMSTTGTNLTQTIIRSLLTFIFIALIPLYRKSGTPVVRKGWHVITFILVFAGLSFVRIPYVSDFTDSSMQRKISVENQKLLTHNLGDSLQWDQKKKLLCFFSTTCPHCFTAAKKIGINLKKGDQIDTYIIFPDNQKGIDEFKKETGINTLAHCQLTPDEFIDIAGRMMPSIFMVEGENFKYWVGSNFNYLALDQARSPN